MNDKENIKINSAKTQVFTGINQYFTLLFTSDCDSTQSAVRSLLETERYYGEIIALCSASQRRGKGRFDRTFVSPKNAGVYLTAAFPCQNEALSPILSGLVALSVVDTISYLTNQEARIKWPNDVVIEGKKVAGILPESVIIRRPTSWQNDEKNADFSTQNSNENAVFSTQNELNSTTILTTTTTESQGQNTTPANVQKAQQYMRYYLLGVGVNVNTTKAQLRDLPNATSLVLQGSSKKAIDVVAGIIFVDLYSYVNRLNKDADLFVQQYIQRCDSVGKTIVFDTQRGRKSGVITAINNDLSVDVRCDDGVHNISWGEVTY